MGTLSTQSQHIVIFSLVLLSNLMVLCRRSSPGWHQQLCTSVVGGHAASFQQNSQSQPVLCLIAALLQLTGRALP